MSDKTKILYIDIETAPDVVYTWGIGRKVFLSPDNIITERQIICICWKWSDEDKVHAIHWGLFAQNDKSLLKTIVPILQEAKLIVGHNSDKFDLRFINGRLMYHKLPAIGKLGTEDTLKLLRKTTYLNSYKLDYISQYLKIGEKLSTTYSLWKDVLAKKSKALRQMIAYCKQDVLLTQEVHETISPYVDHPVNKSLLISNEKDGCPACAESIKHCVKNGFKYNSAGQKQRWICKKCSHPFLTNIRAARL